MAKTKKKLTAPQQEWIAARRRFRLSHAHVQMARELGMTPRSLGGMANRDQEPWKAPLPEHLEHLYQERFGRPAPAVVRSIEEAARLAEQKRAARKAKKRAEAAELAADRRLVESPVRVEAALPPGAEDLPRSEAPEHRISDALVDVMKPFVAWPPAARDLKPFSIMLELTAAVWNASLASDERAREIAFDRLAEEIPIGTLPRDEIRSFVADLAARKLELYASDRRLVTEARVRLDGERLLVTATGVFRPA